MAMSEQELEIARMVKINADTLPTLISTWGGGCKIHGDYLAGNVRYWDIEFPNMHSAVSFAETIKHSDDVLSVDIRFGDSIESLWRTVVITIAQKVD